MAEKSSLPAWLVAAIGFLSGAAFLWLADRILPHAHFFAKEGEVEGIPTNWRRSILLVFSITLHNIHSILYTYYAAPDLLTLAHWMMAWMYKNIEIISRQKM